MIGLGLDSSQGLNSRPQAWQLAPTATLLEPPHFGQANSCDRYRSGGGGNVILQYSHATTGTVNVSVGTSGGASDDLRASAA